MPGCSVIQSFDFGKLDKRFNDVYRPGLEDAGLEAYWVDRNPGVDIPIEDVIRDAAVCLGLSRLANNSALPRSTFHLATA
jgi:hypothetical protein